MKITTLICEILVLMVVMYNTSIGQRTSSAVQTVTFGVHRSSLSILSNLSRAQRAAEVPTSFPSTVVREMGSTYPLKVTVDGPSNRETTRGSKKLGRSSPSGKSGSGAFPSRSENRIAGQSPDDETASIVTITE